MQSNGRPPVAPNENAFSYFLFSLTFFSSKNASADIEKTCRSYTEQIFQEVCQSVF